MVDDSAKYGSVMTSGGGGLEEIKYVTSTCSLDVQVDPTKQQHYGPPPTSNNGQMGQNGGQSSQATGGGAGNAILMANGGGGGEEDGLNGQQVKTEDNTHSYVLPPFLH